MPSTRDDLVHLDAGELGRLHRGHARDERVHDRAREPEVDSAVLHGAGEREQVIDELAQAHPALRHHLGEHERHEQPVALAHVAGDADPAALFAADEHAALDHLLVDPLEAHRSGDHFESQPRSQTVDDHAGRDGLDHLAAHPLVLEQVPSHERDDAVRAHERAVAVDSTDAVGVAVGDEGSVEGAVSHGRGCLVGPGRDGFGVQPAEARIALGVQLVHLDAH